MHKLEPRLPAPFKDITDGLTRYHWSGNLWLKVVALKVSTNLLLYNISLLYAFSMNLLIFALGNANILSLFISTLQHNISRPFTQRL